MSNPESEYLAAYLQQRDVACPACTYNLRGLATDRCPECHQQLVMSVSLAEPPIVQFVLATIGLAACGVCFAMGLVVVILISAVEKGFPNQKESMVLIWAPLAIAIVDAVGVAKFLSASCRRWFRTSSRRRRWTVVGSCWGVSLLILSLWVTALLKVM